MRSGILAALVAVATSAVAQTPTQRYLEWAEPRHDADVYESRRSKLVGQLGSGVLLVPSHHGVSDGFSFRQLDDFWYLTGLELPSSMLILDADRSATILFVPDEDERFTSTTRPNDFPGRALRDDQELWTVAGLNDIRAIGDLPGFLDGIVESGRSLRVNAGHRGDVGAPPTSFFHDWSEADGLIVHLRDTWPDAQLVNAFEAMANVRMIKGPEEIATIRRVVELTSRSIGHAAGFVREGVTERDLEAELEAHYKREGAQRLAFSSIVKSGPNSLWPWRILAAHYDRRNRSMHDGDLVIFDVGTELDGYVSDVGRTFPVSGRFSDRQREILRMEIAVADAIIRGIRPGVTLGDLMERARAVIPSDHRPYMQTGIFFGHFIGMSTGDPALYDIPLQPGMVLTVEPWYYNHDEQISVFTEDVILVTTDGAEILSDDLPRTPEGLEELVGSR